MGNSLEGFSETNESSIGGAPITEKETERGYMMKTRDDRYSSTGSEASEVKFAVSSMQGWRATMEDTHILAPSLQIPTPGGYETLHDHALFSVFDGHGGNFTSDFAGDNFLRIFTQRPEWEAYLSMSASERREVPGVKLVKSALFGAFFDIDSELRTLYKKKIEMYGGSMSPHSMSRGRSKRKKVHAVEEERDSQSSSRQPSPRSMPKVVVDRSGSTAVMVLLTPDHIICCNAGDSRAILCRDGGAMPLSFDHKPNSPSELSRVKDAGGFVRYRRVDGDLAVSRGLGDFRFKMNDAMDHTLQKVSIEPELIVCPRDDDNDQFLVLACDGIWDVMDNQECAEEIQNVMDSGESDMGNICENMLDTCLKRNSRDNMTICVVTLPSGADGIKLIRD